MRTIRCLTTGEVVHSYDDYLQTRHWQGLKKRYLQSKFIKSCEICRASGRIHFHHKTYKRIGQERLTDIVPLCPMHHEDVHAWEKNGQKFKIANTPACRKHWSKNQRRLKDACRRNKRNKDKPAIPINMELIQECLPMTKQWARIKFTQYCQAYAKSSGAFPSGRIEHFINLHVSERAKLRSGTT